MTESVPEDDKPEPYEWREFDVHKAEKGIRNLLFSIGEDIERPGLKDTPKRVVQAFLEMTTGYETDIPSLFTQFEGEKYSQMVVIRDIDFTSLCEHHMLPFVGKCHIAYLPNGPLLGLSKFARLVDAFSRRLQIQERMTQQIADTIQEHMKLCKGVGVVVEAEHSCMSCRGVRKANAIMITTALTGSFLTSDAVRAEFFSSVRG
jgi:GTP cyclohydrolase I